METTTITMIAILVVIALLLVWLSLSMAATEGAVGRVTRASLNNLILEIQTDTEASQFIRDKKIKRIHKVQRLIADRLHLLGYDHVTPEQERQMFGLQRQLLLTFFALRQGAGARATLPAGTPDALAEWDREHGAGGKTAK